MKNSGRGKRMVNRHMTVIAATAAIQNTERRDHQRAAYRIYAMTRKAATLVVDQQRRSLACLHATRHAVMLPYRMSMLCTKQGSVNINTYCFSITEHILHSYIGGTFQTLFSYLAIHQLFYSFSNNINTIISGHTSVVLLFSLHLPFTASSLLCVIILIAVHVNTIQYNYS